MDAERQVEIDRRNTMTRIADEFDAAVGSVVEQHSPRCSGPRRRSCNSQ